MCGRVYCAVAVLAHGAGAAAAAVFFMFGRPANIWSTVVAAVGIFVIAGHVTVGMGV